MTEALTTLASVATQRDHFGAVMSALLDCFRGPSGARLLQVPRVGWREQGRCLPLLPPLPRNAMGTLVPALAAPAPRSAAAAW